MEEDEPESITEGTGGNKTPGDQQHGPDQQQYVEESAQEDTTERTADRNPPSSTVSKSRDKALNFKKFNFTGLVFSMKKNNTEMYKRCNGTI